MIILAGVRIGEYVVNAISWHFLDSKHPLQDWPSLGTFTPPSPTTKAMSVPRCKYYKQSINVNLIYIM